MKPLEEAYLSLRKRLDMAAHSFPLSKDDMEDVIQEGYVRLAEKGITDDSEAKGKFWVTVRNIMIDKFRKKRENISFDHAEITIPEDSHFNLEYDLIRNQMKKILTPRQIKIMTLLTEEELDYPEIAARLNMKEEAVRTSVCRTRKLLKQKIRI